MVRASDHFASGMCPLRCVLGMSIRTKGSGVVPRLTGGIRYPAWPGSTSGSPGEAGKRYWLEGDLEQPANPAATVARPRISGIKWIDG